MEETEDGTEPTRSHNFAVRQEQNNVVLKPASPTLVAHARMRGGRNSALCTQNVTSRGSGGSQHSKLPSFPQNHALPTPQCCLQTIRE